VLVGQVSRALPSQRLEIGALPIDQGQDQEHTADQLVPVANTRPQHPQALGHTAGQRGERHGPGLLAET